MCSQLPYCVCDGEDPREPLWGIDRLPSRSSPSHDWVAWLIFRGGTPVKIQIGGHCTQEHALLIVQQFAGILTPYGLEEMTS